MFYHHDLLPILQVTFRRAPCVFCRFRKDRGLVGTQLNQSNALKHSHKSVIEKCSGFGLHGPKNREQTFHDHTLFTHVAMIGNTNPANAKEGIKPVNLIVQRSVFENKCLL